MLIDINNFGPFHAEVWGTFADWMMIVVTFATLTALIITLFLQRQTLKSQTSVQANQDKITEIEQKRFKFQIRPEFKIKSYYFGNEGKPNVQVTLTNAPAVYLTVHSERHGKFETSSDSRLEFTYHRDETVIFFVVENPEEKNTTLEAKVGHLMFQDELEISCYLQEVWVKNGKPTITLPKIIPSYELLKGSPIRPRETKW